MAGYWRIPSITSASRRSGGSSNRNALSGLRGLKRVLDHGRIATITPDGPRGPARNAAMGPVALAHLSGKPIVPVAWATDRFWRAPGWDGMRIPKPLSRGVLVIGEPIRAPETGDRSAMDEHRQMLEKAMNDTARTADRLAGATDVAA